MSETVDLEEGFVLTWYRKDQPPFRLKMKFVEYLRLHRLVTNVSPKHIWEVLSTGLTTEMEEYLHDSTPWFKKFTEKWQKVLTAEYQRLETEARRRFDATRPRIQQKYAGGELEFHEIRKAFATEFTKPENQEFTGILFAMLDNKDIRPIIWKQVRSMVKNARPLVNGFAY